MKVRLIKKQTIEDYVRGSAQSKVLFERWVLKVKHADWNNPNDIILTFSSADILGNATNRVVFNIGGNSFRMICAYHFGKNNVHLFIKWIGTHAMYTKICKEGKQLIVDSY